MSGFARVYDTEHFKNTGEVIVFDDFRNYFGASANRWIAVANEISGYDCK